MDIEKLKQTNIGHETETIDDEITITQATHHWIRFQIIFQQKITVLTIQN